MNVPATSLVRAIGLATPAPGPLAEAASRIVAQQPLFERHPQFMGHDGMKQVCGAVPSCLFELDPVARIEHLLHLAFAQMAPKGVRNDGNTRMFLALPDWLKNPGYLQDRLQAVLATPEMTQFGPVMLVFNDRVGGLTALQVAQDALIAKQCDIAIVAAADSMVSPMILDHLALSGRPLMQSVAYNPVPAEAAVSMVLTRDNGQADAMIRVQKITKAKEVEKLGDHNRGLLGRALSDACADVMGREPVAGIVADMNGERYRAEELGYVAVSVPGMDFEMTEPVCPALAIGDVGVATGLLACALTPFMGVASDPGDVLLWVGNHNGKRITCRVSPLVNLDVPVLDPLLD